MTNALIYLNAPSVFRKKCQLVSTFRDKEEINVRVPLLSAPIFNEI